MADSLCGPSNALQNFQKHTSVDRTLQQDRLVSRSSPSQGFRSVPGPPSAILDHEFEAFQDGIPAGQPQPHLHHHPPPLASHPTPGPSFAAPSSLDSWAADFQQLHISSPAAPLAQQHHAPQSNASASWHQDFMRQQTPASPAQLSHSAMQPMFGAHPQYGGQQPYFQSLHSGPQSSVASGKQKEQQADEVFDEAAFERAFEAAIAESLEQQQAEHPEILTERVGPIHVRAQEELHEAHLDVEKTTSDAEISVEGPTIIDANALSHAGQTDDIIENEERMRDIANDDDELANTAGKLLESVADNTSKKFQESTFLALMRKLRDKEVRVEGDKMVEAMPAPYRAVDGIPAHEQDADLGRYGNISYGISSGQDTGELRP